MKTRSLALALLALLAAAAPVLADGGFRLEGDTIEDMKLVFDSKGLDRSSPEASATSLLKVIYGVRADPSFGIKFEKASFTHSKKLLGPLLTDEGQKDLFGSQGAKIAQMEKIASEAPPLKVDVKRVDAKEESDGEATLEYKVHYAQKRPCWKCDEKQDPDCKECKGTGIVARDQDETGRVLVKKDGANWLVKSHLTACWACKSDPEKKAECPTCKGTGYREDDFTKGPPGVEGDLDGTLPKTDLASPEAAFATVAGTLRALHVQEASFETRLTDGFKEFAKFLLAPSSAAPPAKRKIELKPLVKLEVTKEDAATYVTYARQDDGGADKEKKVAGRVKLVKSGDSWKVAAFEERCWSCGYGGDPSTCEKCNKKGFTVVKHLPY